MGRGKGREREVGGEVEERKVDMVNDMERWEEGKGKEERSGGEV